MAGKIFASKKRCIWMDAGVILRLCDSDFDCLSCEFDRVMTESATRMRSWRQQAGKPAAQKVKTVPGETRCANTLGNAGNSSS